jgi:carbonic anhydrase
MRTNRTLKSAAALTLMLFAASAYAASHINAMDPNDALKLLKDGNARFAAAKSKNPNTGTERLVETSEQGQHPFAIVLSCSDSRVPVERIFDRGVGDIFVVRVAGNVCSTDEAASIEYAIEHLGPKLLVVVGHSHCGAVKAAIEGGEPGANVEKLLVHIKPAVERACRNHGNLEVRQCLNAAIKENVWQSIEDMLSISSIVRNSVAAKDVTVIGAIYEIDTGKIEWIGKHPHEDVLLKSSGTKEIFESVRTAALEWLLEQTV